MKQLALLLPLLLLLSCRTSTKTLDLGVFTMQVPSNWKSIKVKGIDSYVGKIAIDQTDTVFFDLGWYSNDLEEFYEETIEGKNYYWKSNDTSANLSLLDSLSMEKDRQGRVVWKSIDHRKAKMVIPIHAGKGTVGLYIDSLWKAGINNDRFVIYGQNLNPENEQLFLEALNTLEFKR